MMEKVPDQTIYKRADMALISHLNFLEGHCHFFFLMAVSEKKYFEECLNVSI